MSSEEAFSKYDWAADTNWQKIVRNLEIPPKLNAAEVILKRQRKYYKDNVDASYVAPTVQKPAPEPARSEPARPHTARTEPPRQQYGQQPQGKFACSNPEWYSMATQSLQEPDSAKYVHADCTQYGQLHMLSAPRDKMIDMALTSAICSLSMLYLVPFLPTAWAYLALGWAIKLNMAMLGFRFYRLHGVPRDLQSIMKTIMSSSYAFGFLLSLFLWNATPTFTIAVVLLARVVPLVGMHLREIPAVAGYISCLPTDGNTVEYLICAAEMLLFTMNFLYLPTPARSIVTCAVLMGYQLLRYIACKNTRRVFHQVNTYIKRTLTPYTRVFDVYAFLEKKVYGFVDPNELLAKARQQQQQQGQ